MSKVIGNPTTTPMAIPDWNQKNPLKADYIKNKPNYDEIIAEHEHMIGDLDTLNIDTADNLVDAINELWDGKVDSGQVVYEVDAIDDEYMDIPTVEVTKELINPTPITDAPATLKRNKQYNFGEKTSISLTFPTQAIDGDVIYLTFKSGAIPTALTIDTTNTCDIECIPEANTGYEIFGKYNGSIWIVNYSEYTVSEG